MKILLLLAIALTGCAAQVKTSNPRNVVVYAMTLSQAEAEAKVECGKHNRFARFASEYTRFNYVFDCVE